MNQTPASKTGTASASLEGADLLSMGDLSEAQTLSIFDTARALKDNPARHRGALDGRQVVMLFEKPSLRTRITFDVGIARLGGHAVYLDQNGQKLGEREAIKDYAKNLERWVDAVVARVYSQEALEELRRYNERLWTITELKFFCGLTNRQVGQELGLAESTVENEWTFCKAWLRKRLGDADDTRTL